MLREQKWEVRKEVMMCIAMKGQNRYTPIHFLATKGSCTSKGQQTEFTILNILGFFFILNVHLGGEFEF